MLLDVAGFGPAVARIAGDENVGIEEAVGGFDVYFHVGHERFAGGAAQQSMQIRKQISGHRGVSIRGAAHGEDFAINVFVAERLVLLPRQVIVGPERDFGLGQAHGSPR